MNSVILNLGSAHTVNFKCTYILYMSVLYFWNLASGIIVLQKSHPQTEHLTEMRKRRMGALSSVPTFATEKALMYVYTTQAY